MNKKDLKINLMNKHKNFLELLEMVGGILQSALLKELCLHFNIYSSNTSYYRALHELVDNKILNKTDRNFVSLTKTARAFILNLDSYSVKAIKTDLVNYVIKAKTLRAVYLLNYFCSANELKEKNSSLFLNSYVYLNNLYNNLKKFFDDDIKDKIIDEFNIAHNRNLKIRSNLKNSLVSKKEKENDEDESVHIDNLLQDNRLFVSSIKDRFITLCVLDYSSNLTKDRIQDYYKKCIFAFKNIFLDEIDVKILLLEDSENSQFEKFGNIDYVEVINLDCKKYY